MATKRAVECLLFAVICATVGIACSGEVQPTSPAPDAGVIVPDTSCAHVVVGAAGTTLAHPSGASIVVPPGALAADTSLSLCGISATPPTVAGDPIGQGFEAGPDGQAFLRPVEVVLPIDAARLQNGATAQILMAPHGSTEYTALQTSIDPSGRFLRASTTHFTQFIPVESANPLFITSPAALPDAVVEVPYVAALSASGGVAPYAWSVESRSALPPGLVLSSAGTIGGTPETAGVYAFFLGVADRAGHAVQFAFSMTVNAPVNAVPTLLSVSPTSAPLGASATTIAAAGSGFAPTARVAWDGVPIATSFVNTTSLAATIPASSLAVAGVHQITVTNPPPGGGTSAPVLFTVIANPTPTISSVVPMQIPVSTVDTQVTVTGTGFISGTSAAIGTQLVSTHVVSSTQLLATIPASYLAAPGTLDVDVYNPPPGGGFSGSPVTVAVVGSLGDGGVDASDAGHDAPSDGPLDAPGDVTPDADAGSCSVPPVVPPPSCHAQNLNDPSFVGHTLATTSQVTIISGYFPYGWSGVTALRTPCLDSVDSVCFTTNNYMFTARLGPGLFYLAGGAPNQQLAIEPPPPPAPNVTCANAVTLQSGMVYDEPRLVDGNPRYYKFDVTTPVTSAYAQVNTTSGFGMADIELYDSCGGQRLSVGSTLVDPSAGQTHPILSLMPGTYFVRVTAPNGMKFGVEAAYR